MDAVLPFACPSCGMRSVAVGICPDCRLELVASAMAPAVPPVPDLPGVIHVLQASLVDCRRAADLLLRQGIPASLSEEGGSVRLLVPEGWEEKARLALSEAWDRDVQNLGMDPVTDEEALALEAEGKCPACGDPLMPGGASCPSCGIALT